jgi:hypothetical protein
MLDTDDKVAFHHRGVSFKLNAGWVATIPPTTGRVLFPAAFAIDDLAAKEVDCEIVAHEQERRLLSGALEPLLDRCRHRRSGAVNPRRRDNRRAPPAAAVEHHE